MKMKMKMKINKNINIKLLPIRLNIKNIMLYESIIMDPSQLSSLRLCFRLWYQAREHPTPGYGCQLPFIMPRAGIATLAAEAWEESWNAKWCKWNLW